MEIKKILNSLLNLKFIIGETLANRVSPIYQLLSIIFFLFYEKSIWAALLKSKTNGVYFSQSAILEFSLLLVGLLCLFLYFRKYRIYQIGPIYLNTYFASKVWTLFFFFLYTLITIPISFYMEQNLLGNPSDIFKGGGYFILTLFPTVIVILGARSFFSSRLK